MTDSGIGFTKEDSEMTNPQIRIQRPNNIESLKLKYEQIAKDCKECADSTVSVQKRACSVPHAKANLNIHHG